MYPLWRLTLSKEQKCPFPSTMYSWQRRGCACGIKWCIFFSLPSSLHPLPLFQHQSWGLFWLEVWLLAHPLWVWQDSITVLHNLDKKWAQEHLINLKTGLWPWQSRHTVSSMGHWRSEFSLISFVPSQFVWPGWRSGIAGWFPRSHSTGSAGSGLSNPHMADVEGNFGRYFLPFGTGDLAAALSDISHCPFRARQMVGGSLNLTSQLDQIRTPSPRKALLIIVLHLHRFWDSHFPRATKLVTKMDLRKARAGQYCACISPKSSWLMSMNLTWVCSSSHWAR